MPASIVLVDSLTWTAGAAFADFRARAWFFFVWLVTKTALVSACAGYFLGATFYGWLIFFWCQTLLDFQTMHATLGNSDMRVLAYTLIAAQVGFLALWGILGPTAIGWRLTCILVALTAVIAQIVALGDDYLAETVPAAQVIVAAILSVLCAVLRLGGYRLQSAETIAAASTRPERGGVQFGMKHMLIWAAALGPLMLAFKALNLDVYGQLGRRDVLPAVMISVWTALVVLAAIWLALAAGKWPLRVIVFAAVVAAAGMSMYGQARALLPGLGPWPQERMLVLVVAMGNLWGAWFALIGALLAAMLLFLRTAGYRLEKVQTREAA